MVAQSKPRFVTPEEYLNRERRAEMKSEYEDGMILAMAGASPEHVSITYNFGAALWPQLEPAGCQGYPTELRVRVEASNRYYYPDFTIVCGEPIFEVVAGMRSLRNPKMIVEVLSPSTERQDRGKKFLAYKTLESLATYVLIAQDRPFIEVFTRMEDGDWRHREVSGQDAMLHLPSIGSDLRLNQIYANVKFREQFDEEEG